LGFSFSGEDDVVIGQLHALEVRDKSAIRRVSTSRVLKSLSDDEDN